MFYLFGIAKTQLDEIYISFTFLAVRSKRAAICGDCPPTMRVSCCCRFFPGCLACDLLAGYSTNFFWVHKTRSIDWEILGQHWISPNTGQGTWARPTTSGRKSKPATGNKTISDRRYLSLTSGLHYQWRLFLGARHCCSFSLF